MKAAILEDNCWLDDAVATIIGLAISQDTVTAEDVRRHMRPAPSDKMPGQAFAAARNAGHIEAVGYTTSKSTTRKHGVIRTWRRKAEGVSV